MGQKTSLIRLIFHILFNFSGLVARTSTMKTRVLLSSIFFMADSVVSGYFRMQYWSSLLVLGIDLRGYLGSRALMRVFGLWKVALRRTLVVRFWVPFLMAFAAACAFAAFGLAAGFLASFGGITGLYVEPHV